MKKLLITLLILIPLIIIGLAWFAGNSLTAPAQTSIGNCPNDLFCENVEFSSDSGTQIKGWLVKGESGKGAIVLMHGVRSNRLSLVERIRFLRKAGYSVLAFDFQGSGESEGKQLTFGYLESRDANASLKFIKEKFPNEKIGVMGISMGGAAFLLQNEPQKVDALILEMVYPAIQKAIENRLNLWLFKGADNLSPLLTYQFPIRLGVTVNDLRPLDKIKSVNCPLFFIVGENDHHTTLEESRQLFETANQPKDLWIVPKAEHGDLLKVAPETYEQKVLEFFEKALRGETK
ncbi:MAG: lysophospholipase [Pyrinomonadaceae bacterium]|nr:lysophospholipase [Pyrinomonadaceae bacterium]